MKILSLLTPVFGISLNNTPAANEVYEQVLKNKHNAQDNHEKLLLELSGMTKKWQKADSKKESHIQQLKKDISKLRENFDLVEKAMAQSKFDSLAISQSMERITAELEGKLKSAETSINKQHSQAEELIQKIDEELANIQSDYKSKYEKSWTETQDIHDRLDGIEIRQEEFIRMTKSQLSELSKIESNGEKMLESIRLREEKNKKEMLTIEKFEEATKNKIDAQERELQMLQKSMRAMQNRLNVDEFKEEKLQETMTQMTLEMLNKIAQLENEIVELLSGNTVANEKQDEINLLADELASIENLILYQQTEIKNMDVNNERQVAELHETDSSLRSKLFNVEQDIHKIGSGIVFRNQFMKKFRY